ncbi:MAG: aldolase/citrate lyase family protein, partial [Pseudomonadota bacterium]
MDFILITNDPVRATAAQSAGVDRIMVDLEINGKVERQGHLNTVISKHSLDDVAALRTSLEASELMVRVNPVFNGSAAEIDACIDRGADRLMLPMFTTPEEVTRFLDMVAGRAKTSLLLETPQAMARIEAIATRQGVEEIHIGLNDLHLGLGLDFMFEILSGGLMDHCAAILNRAGIKHGFGGIARLDQGDLPSNRILAEHVRLGSSQVILSRDFWQIFEDKPDGAAAVLKA